MLLIEGTTKTRADWLIHLSCTTAEFDYMVDRGAFDPPKAGAWRLRFVGTMMLVDNLWLCLPSIYQADFNIEKFDLIDFERLSQTLEVYSRRSIARNAGHDNVAADLSPTDVSTSPLREIEILAALIDWTFSYGFHTNDAENFSSEFNRATQWSKTLEFSIPIHTKTGTIYDRPISANAARKQTELTGMQAQILLYLLDKYSVVTHRLIDDAYDLITEARIILEYWQEKLPISQPVLQELLDATNRDHEKDLISLLLAFVNIRNVQQKKNEIIKFYGTTAFELVWEDMCRNVFLKESWGDARLSNPRYDIEDFYKNASTSPQRPDIIFSIENIVIVLDAKYYVGFPSIRPNLEDIRKQIFYALSLPAETPSISGFLFPRLNSICVEYLGCVSMHQPLFSDDKFPKDLRFPSIQCIGLPWKEMVSVYLERSSPKAVHVAIRDQLFKYPAYHGNSID